MSREVAPTVPIQELLDDSELQTWVKVGMPYHRSVRSTCGFCGQPLPPTLWERLDEHFSEDAAELEAAIEREVAAIEAERQAVGAIPRLEVDDFYETLRPSAKRALSDRDVEVASYLQELDALEGTLERRKKDIFRQQNPPEVQDRTSDLRKKVTLLSSLVDQHNEKTGSLWYSEVTSPHITSARANAASWPSAISSRDLRRPTRSIRTS